MYHTITFLPLDIGKQKANATSDSYNILVAALCTGQSSLLILKFVVNGRDNYEELGSGGDRWQTSVPKYVTGLGLYVSKLSSQ